MSVTQAELLMQCVEECLKAQGLVYEMVGTNRDIFELSLDLRSKIKTCRVLIFTEDDAITVYAICPVNADASSMADVAEFITRANYGLRASRFDLDYSDGEVRHKSCLLCTAGIPSMQDVKKVIAFPVVAMERYGDGLLKNILGFGNPAEDIKEIKGN